ncbi:AMP-binding protein [Litorivicinus lipolyticus]|uniref:AMP-binding protein n=1 Tax=Litorivicinus lipolyticus TaxID=418701 RepID=A0A5Q2Q886_9GAMM|nr:AMP-binding protein [Litorivicinus lipolyticus]QGG79253.1 AMP-binding protein [Litorivicinus lipolyticus]
MSSNLFSHIETALARDPDSVILETLDGTETRAEALLEAVDRMASLLASLGLKPGERLSAQVDKDAMNVVLYLACLKAGGVYLPLNSGYTDSEIEYFLSDAEPVIHVCTTSRQAGAEAIAARLGGLQVQTLDLDGGSLRAAFEAHTGRFGATVARAPSDLASFLYTSGTTGKPKGAMLTHNNLLSNAQMLTQAWDYSTEDTLLHALPLFHVHGLFVALNLALVNAAKVILLPKYEVEAVLQALPRTRVMMGVPTYYTRLLSEARFDRALTGHMRLFISGSAPLLVETSDQFFERTGQRILERYGMTETGMSCSNPLNGDRRAGSVGPALPGVQARIVSEDGAPSAAGEIGSLQVKGDHVFAGYWKLPEKTASEFTDDGFFVTGDLATLSDDGYVSIVGRGKDLIITGGLNVYPKEIEDVLNDMPGIKESAVIGVPHPDFGEGIVAVLVAEDTLDLDAVKAACRVAMAAFKLPRTWHIVDELPRNTMGKVQKNLLRERFG